MGDLVKLIEVARERLEKEPNSVIKFDLTHEEYIKFFSSKLSGMFKNYHKIDVEEINLSLYGERRNKVNESYKISVRREND